MSDDLDLVQSRLEVEVAAALTHISGTIPVGVRGECDDCGEDMPRLVGGLCGFCRDGRRPPLDRYPVPAPIASAAPRFETASAAEAAPTPAPGVVTQQEEDTMVKAPAILPNRKITIEGAALKAVERRAQRDVLSFKQAAEELIEMGERAAAQDTTPPAADRPLTLSEVSSIDLVAELTNRVIAGSPEMVAAAVARAEAAEARLATIKQAVAEAGVPA